MVVSSRGRYALRVMIDIAQHNSNEYIKLIDIANRQEISEKYLEGIMSQLSKNGFVSAVRGKGGGYKLNCSPDECTVASVLRVTEGSLAPVACLEKETNDCKRASKCPTLKMWTQLYDIINEFFEGITIGDLVQDEAVSDREI